MKKGIILVVLLTVILTLIGCSPRNAPNNLIVAKEDEETILNYLDMQTDDISSPNLGKMYSAYEILGTDTNRIYMWVIKEECTIIGKDVNMSNGVSLPVVLYIQTMQDGIVIEDHKVPRDGVWYGQDIKQLFPENVILAMQNDHNERVAKLEEKIHARVYVD